MVRSLVYNLVYNLQWLSWFLSIYNLFFLVQSGSQPFHGEMIPSKSTGVQMNREAKQSDSNLGNQLPNNNHVSTTWTPHPMSNPVSYLYNCMIMFEFWTLHFKNLFENFWQVQFSWLNRKDRHACFSQSSVNNFHCAYQNSWKRLM